jgi:acyl dehydratase
MEMSQIDLTPGAEIPTFVRKSDFDAWNRYAAVNDEFVPIHMDDEAGKAAGFPGAIGMGNLSFSYLHNLLRAFIGDEGRIKSISVKYNLPNLRGSVTTTHGKIVSVAGSEVVLELWVDDDAGRVLLNGQATVEVAA